MGLCCSQYVLSLLTVVKKLEQDGWNVSVKMTANESLINRGRNTDSTEALIFGFNKILFIDSDIIFDYAKVRLLLDSGKEIIGGTYAVKAFPVTLNFNPLPDQCDLFSQNRQQENYFQWVEKYADSEGVAEVRHVPTGFLLVDTRVLAKLSHKVPWYRSFDTARKQHENYYEFFPTSVVGEQLLSEDWGFCHVARENGFKVHLQTRAVVGHIGTHTYGLGQFQYVMGQEPLIPRGKALAIENESANIKG